MLIVPRRRVATGGDPFFPNVSFLLQPTSEANGSTTFIDKSSNNLAITRVGNAVWDTGATLFGLPTMLLDGSSHLGLPLNVAALAVGASDFTIEAWVLRSNANTSVIFAGQSDYSTVAGSAYITYVGTTASDLYSGGTRYSVASPDPSTGSFVFVQYVRSGGTWQTRSGGSVVATNTNIGSDTVNTGAANYAPAIGRLDNSGTGAGATGGSAGLAGRIAALRITKGVARPSTVPTGPFPTF